MAVYTKKRDSGAHWYGPDGTPMHRVPKIPIIRARKLPAPGDLPPALLMEAWIAANLQDEDWKKTTIAEARIMCLLPSSTTILSIFDKPALKSWAIEQAVLATLTAPKPAGQDPRAWAKNIADLADQQVSDAAELGKDIHDALEKAFRGEKYPKEFEVYVLPVLALFVGKKLDITGCEVRCVNIKHGFAGTTDLLLTFGSKKLGRGVVDYKTRKSVAGKPIPSYDGEIEQLASYFFTHYGEEALETPELNWAANVLISTTEPGRVEAFVHTLEKGAFEKAWFAFLSARDLWEYRNDYSARTPV